MAAIAIKPPTKRQARKYGGDRKYFTLHSTHNNVFTVMGASERACIVAFRRKADALRMGRMIEQHVLTTKSWPEITMGGTTMRVFANETGPDFLMFLDMATWDDIKKLEAICSLASMDILELHEVVFNEEAIKFRWTLRPVFQAEDATAYLEHLFSLDNPAT